MNKEQWECTVCGFVYDETLGLPADGIVPGTALQALPPHWLCPDCGMGVAEFVPAGQG